MSAEKITKKESGSASKSDLGASIPLDAGKSRAAANDKTISRHCALCLIPLALDKVQLCGWCNRRAYCSRDCLLTDWGNPWTQCHKNWCKLNCGEEDLDWKVGEVPGKGLGLIALNDITAGSRIMVDAPRQHKHPRVMDLAPVDGTRRDKIRINSIESSSVNEEGGDIYFRISRANHACLPNAFHYHDETFNVKVLFAERDIHAGDEICISYIPFFDYDRDSSGEDVRAILNLKWGIPDSSCLPNCICRDAGIKKIIDECAVLDQGILDLSMVGRIDKALELVRKLLRKQKLIHASLLQQAKTLYTGFSVAIQHKRTLELAKEYLRKSYEIKSKIASPESAEIIQMKGYLDNPASYEYYLFGER